MWDTKQPVKVRIAPSPTGEPHVGTAYIGLFNYAFAKKHGGKFILRIEDTDRERSTKESEQSIFDCMEWLGLRFDESPAVGGPCGPYRQSERSALYREHVEKLIANGSAYRCFCTAARLDQLREQAKAAGGSTRYDGHCRDLPSDEVARRLAAGEAHVVRLRIPPQETMVVKDLLRGEVRYETSEVDDQVLMKSDGFPTYHLANVVDDHLMGVTHVCRAEEWLASTPKHMLLYRAFGWLEPTWIHMPLLRNPDKGKSKISKRKNPVSLRYYRRRGFLPEALLNFLGNMGWSFPEQDRELFTLKEFEENFTFDRISLGGPVFDLTKLEWMNGQYLRALSRDEFVRRLREHLGADPFWTAERVAAAAPLVQDRLTTLGDFDVAADFMLPEPLFTSLLPFVEAGARLDALREGFQKLRETFERAGTYWNDGELLGALGKFDDNQKKLCQALFKTDDDARLVERLVYRGKNLSLKMFQDAGETVKRLVPKGQSTKDLAALLRGVASSLREVPAFEAPALEEALKTRAEASGMKTGDFYMPIRIAATGRSATPPLFESMALVGREGCVERLERAAKALERVSA